MWMLQPGTEQGRGRQACEVMDAVRCSSRSGILDVLPAVIVKVDVPQAPGSRLATTRERARRQRGFRQVGGQNQVAEAGNIGRQPDRQTT